MRNVFEFVLAYWLSTIYVKNGSRRRKNIKYWCHAEQAAGFIASKWQNMCLHSVGKCKCASFTGQDNKTMVPRSICKHRLQQTFYTLMNLTKCEGLYTIAQLFWLQSEETRTEEVSLFSFLQQIQKTASYVHISPLISEKQMFVMHWEASGSLQLSLP